MMDLTRAKFERTNCKAFRKYVGRTSVRTLNLKPFRYVSLLYKKCLVVKNNADKNWAISPLSILLAMVMVLHGTSGKTRKEIRQALGIVAKIEYISNIQPKKSDAVVDKDDEENLDIDALLSRFKLSQLAVKTAGKLYLNERYKICDDYKENVKSLDVSDLTEAARMINLEVSKATDEKIGDIISSGDMSKNSVSLLVSAFYFQQKFLEAFNPKHSIKASFHGCSEDITFMHKTGMIDHCNFHESYYQLKAKGVRLELEKDMFLVIVIPNNKDGLKQINEQLKEPRDELFLKCMLEKKKYTKKQLDFYVPKFKLDGHFEVTKILEAMGIEEAFSKKADFRKISNSKIRLGSVHHKAVMLVNESGVKTAPEPSCQSTRCQLKADHPFLVAVVTNNDIPILLGNVWEPNYPDSTEPVDPSSIGNSGESVLMTKEYECNENLSVYMDFGHDEEDSDDEETSQDIAISREFS
ncbi:hypothetical protein Ciccas_002032 [Cichlidogyrus casuarinus]|uniref:Serpin domain-containing protein n=1 Tax=Cichlidogyrus casuarinus TaxID=1844966 RepID=A0ABD2QIG5_9PLAT